MSAPTVNEKTTSQYSCSFVDNTGAAIAHTSVSAIAATLRDVKSGRIINSRNSQNVLNANGGTMAVSGVFTLVLGTDDNVAVAGSGDIQKRRLTLKVTYTSGVLTKAFTYYVQALDDIT